MSVADEVTPRARFLLLVRVFIGRVFHGSGDTGAEELDLSMGVVLSLLLLPGGFYSIFLFDKYGSLMHYLRSLGHFDPVAAALPDEYFFIALSMVVTAVVAVWRWDSIFPDRRDYANLVPLPLRTRAIFLANLIAIAFLAVVLAVDVNAASGLMFPTVVSASEDSFVFFLHFAAVHLATVVLASIFSFFAVFALIGVMMLLLPDVVFRRLSLYLRSLIILALVALLSTSYAVPALVGRLPQSVVRFLPSVWFLGLCQLMRHHASPPLASLGRMALLAFAGVITVSIVTYAASYHRRFLCIPETLDTAPKHTRNSGIFSLLDRAILKTPFERAGYRFIIKTLARSERHGMVLGGFVGLGIVLASQVLFAAFNTKTGHVTDGLSAEVLSIPLILSYCIIAGLRAVIEIPIELRANWIFRLCLDQGSLDCAPLVRKVMLSFILPWVLVIVFPVYGYLWGWVNSLFHVTVITVWSALLAEILLVRYRKVPFACSYPPFRDSAIVVVLSYVLGFFVFVMATSDLEYWATLDHSFTAVFVLAALGIWYVLLRYRRNTTEIEKQIIFEEQSPAGFEVLDLGRG